MNKYVVLLPLTLSMLCVPHASHTDGKMYNAPKDYTYKQKVWQGKVKEKKYTTCRLKKRIKSQITGQQACIYQGGNNTYELMIEKFCPKKFKCVYKPGQKEPNIDDVMESLRSVGKSN